jgi:hypothetical protein
MGLDDFAAADDAAFDPNDDLFEMPSDEGPGEGDSKSPARPHEPSRGREHDVLDSLDAPLPSRSPHADICSGLDPELDEDLFGFPPLDLSSLGIEDEPLLRGPLAERAQHTSKLVTDLLDDDLGDMIRETHEEQQRELGETPEDVDDPRAPLPSEHEEDTRRGSGTSKPRAAAGAQAPGTTYAVVAASQRPLWVLTAGVIVFMLGLLGIAWRATSSFQTQIEQVQADVRSTSERLQQSASVSNTHLAQLEAELGRNRSAAQSDPRGARTAAKAPPMEAPHDMTLEVALGLVDSQRFVDARRMLFSLLATADRLPAEHRSRVEEEARFLIARSYAAEADVHAGAPE